MEFGTHCLLEELNSTLPPVSVAGRRLVFGAEDLGGNSEVRDHCLNHKRKRGNVNFDSSGMYEDSSSTKGGLVKALGHVLRVRNVSRERGPNVICKVELFGKIVNCLDQKCKGWVIEMGFGGLLYLVNMKLPRSLCYWLMTRIDPVNERLLVGGLSFRFSCNQVRWVLGLPKGVWPVPSSFHSVEESDRVMELEMKYGQVWRNVDGRSGKVVLRRGLSVTPAVVERLQSHFDDCDVGEFKMLFLLVALDMVLCPTQCSRFPKELFPALACASSTRNFNWCSLVLDKLMASAKRFAHRFYTDGFAGGCGGCTLFLAIFYLDRLKRNAVDWGQRPRIKVWTDDQIKKACNADRPIVDVDFGYLGVLDVAYGEDHPLDARDADCSSEDNDDLNI